MTRPLLLTVTLAGIGTILCALPASAQPANELTACASVTRSSAHALLPASTTATLPEGTLRAHWDGACIGEADVTPGEAVGLALWISDEYTSALPPGRVPALVLDVDGTLYALRVEAHSALPERRRSRLLGEDGAVVVTRATPIPLRRVPLRRYVPVARRSPDRVAPSCSQPWEAC